jgi:hypothetical protein
MGYKRDMIMLAVLSVVMIVISAAGIVWDFFSGLLFGGLDGILLLAVCLMTGGVFTLELLIVGRQAGWVPSRASAAAGGKSAAVTAPAAKSAPAAVPRPAVATPAASAAPTVSRAAAPYAAPTAPSVAPALPAPASVASDSAPPAPEPQE